MGLLRAVTIHHSDSGLPEDDMVNVLHFGTPPAGGTLAIWEDIVDAIQAFWSAIPTGGTAAPETYLSSVVDAAAGRDIVLYEKEAGEALFGTPVHNDLGSAIAATATAGSMPAEVALALSYHGDLSGVQEEEGVTRPRARRRGRIFVGPFRDGVDAGDVLGQPNRPATSLVEDLGFAASDLLADSDASADWSWVVAHASNAAGWSTVPVIGGWVDDEWDTIRKRGRRATSRTSWS